MGDQSSNLSDWVSAIATAMAAIVALIIPFIMDHLANKRRKAEDKRALRELCFSVDQVVLRFLQVRNMVKAADATQQGTRFRQISVETAAVADALGRMLQRSGLTDGPLVAGSAAIELARGVSGAASTAADQKPDNASVQLIPYEHVAQLAFSRSERVRNYHSIPRGPSDEKPNFL